MKKVNVYMYTHKGKRPFRSHSASDKSHPCDLLGNSGKVIC